jgi:hypothetical protein
VPMAERFIADTKWVRSAVLQTLGQFIASLTPSQVRTRAHKRF